MKPDLTASLKKASGKRVRPVLLGMKGTGEALCHPFSCGATVGRQENKASDGSLNARAAISADQEGQASNREGNFYFVHCSKTFSSTSLLGCTHSAAGDW